MSTDAKKPSGKLVSIGHGKTVLMPDIYAERPAFDDEPSDQSVVEFDESNGFDPYDTASLYIKKRAGSTGR